MVTASSTCRLGKLERPSVLRLSLLGSRASPSPLVDVRFRESVMSAMGTQQTLQ